MDNAIVEAEELPRPSALQIGARAATRALMDAGIDRLDVDALFTGRAPQSYLSLQYNQALLSELKLEPRYNTSVTAHGAGALGTLELATSVLQSEEVDYALCVTNEAAGLWLNQSRSNAGWEADLEFEAPYGAITPALYAQFASRYIYEYGIRAEHAAKVAVENRKWAIRHPDAAMRDKGSITVEEVLESPVIATPFRRLDCAVWYPGAIATAVVLTRTDRAYKEHSRRTQIRGIASSTTHERVTERLNRPGDSNGFLRTGAAVAADGAYKAAGLKPQDIDVLETSAPFTYVILLMLEEFGFCPPGQGGEFVADGGVDFGGRLAFNTNGGYLSFGQVPQGLYMLTESVDQLDGNARGEQVNNPRTAMVHGHGGPLACHCVCILERD
jgi:acetyl-CoA acetyltransferase